MASSWWKCASRTGTKTRRGLDVARRTTSRPVLELLESRVVPSTVYWTGSQDTNWDNAGNWSLGSIPAAGDDVIVNQAGAVLIHYNFSGTPDTIHSFNVQASNVTLTLFYGTLDLSGGVAGVRGTFQAAQAGDA